MWYIWYIYIYTISSFLYANIYSMIYAISIFLYANIYSMIYAISIRWYIEISIQWYMRYRYFLKIKSRFFVDFSKIVFFFALEIRFWPEKPITYGGSLGGFWGQKSISDTFQKSVFFIFVLRFFVIGVLCGKQKVLTLIMSTFCIRFVQIIGVKPFGVLVVAYAQGQKRNPHIQDAPR